MTTKLLLGGLAAVCLFAQVSPPIQKVFVYSGSTLVATCEALSYSTADVRVRNTGSVTGATSANPIVVTSTAHGFDLKSRPVVRFAGMPGNFAALNGRAYTATIINANSFSVAVDGSAFAAFSGTASYTTNAPRLTLAEWNVTVMQYDGSSNLLGMYSLGGSGRFDQKCSDAQTAGTNIQ